MRRHLTFLSIFIVLTPISLSLPAHAAPDDVVMLQDQGHTPGWDAYVLTSEGGRYTFDWTFTVTRDPVQVGLIHYDGQDSWLGSFHYTSFTYQNSHRYELNAIPGMHVKAEEVRDAYGYQVRITAGGPLPGSPANPETRKLLVWTSGAVEQGWSLSLTGPSSAELARDSETNKLISTSGPAYVYLSKDLGGAANVGAQGSVPPNDQLPTGMGPGARAAVTAGREFPVSSSLVGGVGKVGEGSPFGAQAATIDIYTPSGFRKQCHLPALVTNEGPCAFHHIAGPQALGAGEYRLQFTGAGAGVGPFGDLLFWYLDAHLPSLPDAG